MIKNFLCLIVVTIALTGILSVDATSDMEEVAELEADSCIENLDSFDNNRKCKETNVKTDLDSLTKYSNEDNNSAVESITENSESLVNDVTISLKGDKKMDLKNTTELIMDSNIPSDNSTDKNDLKPTADAVSSWNLAQAAAENSEKDLGSWAIEFTFCVF